VVISLSLTSKVLDMPNLYRVNQELAYAKEEFQKYVGTQKSLDPDTFRNWNSFVTHLERSFNKAQEIGKQSGNKYRNAVNQAIGERRRDKLLSYLKNSRDVYEHSGEDIAGMRFTSYKQSGEMMLTRISTDENGVETSTTEIHPMYPSAPRLVTVVNYGKPYTPPDIHQGKKLNNRYDPIEVGQLALQYYENLYAKIATIED
jgi:hypothetical protein